MENKIFASLCFVRDMGSHVILTSIVKKEDLKELEDGFQYVLTGKMMDNGPFNFILHKDHPIDRKKETTGVGIDGVLKSTIWQTS